MVIPTCLFVFDFSHSLGQKRTSAETGAMGEMVFLKDNLQCRSASAISDV